MSAHGITITYVYPGRVSTQCVVSGPNQKMLLGARGLFKI